jgi:hypothetical protein
MHAITSRTGKINSSASPTNGRLLIHLGYRNSEKFGSGFPCVNIGKDFSFTLFGLFHSSKCLFDSLQRDDRDAIAIPNDEITATYWHACVCRKPKSARNGDEVRRGLGAI